MKPKAFTSPNPNFQEIIRLHEKLSKAGIDHEFLRLYDGWQVLVLRGNHIISAIEHFNTDGHQDDRIEIAGYRIQDDPVGWLTADECYEIIRNNFTEAENNARD